MFRRVVKRFINATILKPMIYQLLLQKKRGVPLGISVVEPKGDVAAMVNEMCLEMDIPCIHVDPDKPNSASFNPMEGDTDTVAEATFVGKRQIGSFQC
ncbi:hypothetical protein [Sporosarcina sp. FSL K6-3457]|uniref:hypothetical protein n=1 Tax=Sporosarcina sp. FSL K6-3457 TaxID=2978204 RepID=UPI0030FC98C6